MLCIPLAVRRVTSSSLDLMPKEVLMFGYGLIFVGAAILILGPIPIDIPYFNQVLGLALIIGGPWMSRAVFGR